MSQYERDTNRSKRVTVTFRCVNPECAAFGDVFSEDAELYMGSVYADMECPECFTPGEQEDSFD